MTEKGLLKAGGPRLVLLRTVVRVPFLNFEIHKRSDGIKRNCASMRAGQRIAQSGQKVFCQIIRGLRHLGTPLTTSCYIDGNCGSRSPSKLGSNT